MLREFEIIGISASVFLVVLHGRRCVRVNNMIIVHVVRQDLIERGPWSRFGYWLCVRRCIISRARQSLSCSFNHNIINGIRRRSILTRNRAFHMSRGNIAHGTVCIHINSSGLIWIATRVRHRTRNRHFVWSVSVVIFVFVIVFVFELG